MKNTDELTLDQIDELNGYLRYADVTEEDVRQIAAELKLGEATVRRWFDSTNNGDYSPAIPAAAAGKEDYLLEQNGLPEYDEYGQAVDAYEEDAYLNGEDEFGDTDEDINSDAGIVDPSEASLHSRLILAALLSDVGYSREPEPSVTYTGNVKTWDTPEFATLGSLADFVEQVINGQVSRFAFKSWYSFKAYHSGEGWGLDFQYFDKAKGEGS